MSNCRKRIAALEGLTGIATLLVVFCMLPLSSSYLEKHRWTWRTMRAWMRGALFATGNEVVLQRQSNDCGAAALKMILDGHGVDCRLSDLASHLQLTPKGTSMLNLRLAAAERGVPAKSWMIHPSDLPRVPLPAIAFINKNHFVVIRRLIAPGVLEVDDPALGRLHWPLGAFQRVWSGETLVFDPAWSPL